MDGLFVGCRECARISRRRKKEYIQGLELEIESLKSEIESLRQTKDPKVADHFQETIYKASMELERNLESLMIAQNLATKESVTRDIERQLDSLLVTIRQRLCESIELQFNQTANLLRPLPFVCVFLWAICQSSDSHKMVEDELIQRDEMQLFQMTESQMSESWMQMERKLELSDQQRLAFNQIKGKCHSLKSDYLAIGQQCLAVKEKASQCLSSVIFELFEQLRSIFTPIQQAKYLVWAHRNQALMKMMNSIWRENI